MTATATFYLVTKCLYVFSNLWNLSLFSAGPFKEEIILDFWLMIWQQRPSAIVMVTNLYESAKVGKLGDN